MDALLIIDMQKASFKQVDRYDASGTVKRINDLGQALRASGGSVIFIQHSGTEENGHLRGTEGWEILDSLHRANSDRTVHKTTCDSFYNTSLKRILAAGSFDRIVVAGCATDFCVDSTIRSALSHEFCVIVPSDCHTTADRPNLSAQDVIDYHNWLWKNLIPPCGVSIEVVSSADLIGQYA